uniref:AN1-type zinc finger protein 6 isoform X1 n=1 Tax=Oncorhynchus gorbuscha TaxID=8017 RepID=UPI001EAEED87|nr:AN1-type zinc finger protein 6 isoform X1 [Oncorhynchus gorbuscha]XP_046204926.1 AN1-type zinc finger protein 6 isoform X1 [Oncorhynchus gorbuscha]XP_046204927.1 AN1-type zinc finger protein 6 isoform X1 [Oncorhynchus gorbuscha]XP_046204928.1 AN1-type zinc finger protein 6 isoform X1 [Oncorhynchus gorbuscha]
MAQETNQNQGPLLCTTGCGFYSNPRNNGMCSMCYKDFLQRQNNNGRVSPPVSSSAAVNSLGESLLAQCSESSTVDVPSATTHTDTRMNRYSRVVSSQSLLTTAPATHSEEERTATSEEDLKTEEIQVSVSVSEDTDQASVDGQDKPSDSDQPKAAKKNRCFSCRKKVGLTGFDCRCGNVFCGMHRYSDVHNCTFNYKADAAEKIRKANPVCVGEKIQKI